ncbi:hypothetical protein [Motilimonas pumila]|uniref:Cytochrome P460 domain-containing protein n=1 Tax=Motilimonas pumila TaxID=2303987 RepID=A0A418YHF3_9GAMM|nr:hypothetical protein [Motilimonas pumila]RJG49528.1 hypothetical protein D1Z90_06105 [Motilimonas pumila]
MWFNPIKVGIAVLALVSPSILAESVASYPVGWESWPVVKESQNLPADTVLPPDTSLFIQESVKAYDWINNGLGSPLTIRVNPEKLEQYKTHGPYTDGPTVVAISEVQGIIWVTEHLSGLPIYGSYNRKGEDISSMHPSLEASFCHQCHDAYKDICINGTCTEPVLGVYEKQ